MPKGIYIRIPGKYPHNPRSLTPNKDLEIAVLYKEGKTQDFLKRKFHVGRQQIRASLRRTGTSTAGRNAMPGSKNPAWKGGRVTNDGYVRLFRPNHPNASSQGYVAEHRLIMEEVLGRLLDRKEVVHHKNGDKMDNRPENLLVFQNNGAHLGIELLGKCPKWTEGGLQKIRERSIPSMKGTLQSTRGTGVRGSRKRLILEYLHETSDLLHSGPEAAQLQLPSYQKRRKKPH